MNPEIGLHSIHLEAYAPSVYIKSSGWIAAPSKQSYTRLSPSTQSTRILYNLRPDEMFKIGDWEFTLQANSILDERNVQVESSRPDDGNDDGRVNGQDSPVLALSRPETPHPASGPTVLETPVTTRHVVQQVEAGAPPHNALFLPTSARATLSQDAESPCRNAESIVEDCINKQLSGSLPSLIHKSAPPEESIPSVQDGGQSSLSTEASSQGSSKPRSSQGDEPLRSPPVIAEITSKELTPKPRMSNKRSASADPTSEHPHVGSPVLVDIESAPGIEETGVLAPTRKRQKLGMGQRSIMNAAEESQSSIRSTIHVEAPDIAPLPPALESDALPIPESTELEELSSSSNSEDDKLRNEPKSIEPPSSIRSTRSTGQVQQGLEGSQNPITRIYYSSSSTVKDSIAYTNFLRQHNIKHVKNAADCDVLCTGKGEVKRTSNLILTVLRGKAVVTDQWVIQSATSKKLLDTTDFIPESPARAKDWGTSLGDAICRGRRGLKPLEGWTINFTPNLKKELNKNWSELKDICLAAGADAVQAMIPRKTPRELGSTVVVVAAANDPDEAALEERGWKMFSKEIITYSVLRGKLDADSDEFLMKSTKKGVARGRKKK